MKMRKGPAEGKSQRLFDLHQRQRNDRHAEIKEKSSEDEQMTPGNLRDLTPKKRKKTKREQEEEKSSQVQKKRPKKVVLYRSDLVRVETLGISVSRKRQGTIVPQREGKE